MRHLAPLLALVVLSGCRSSQTEALSTDAGPASVPLAAPTALDASAPTATRTAPTKASLAGQSLALYKKELSKGREHAKAKRWAEAVVAFEAALQAVPGNARALSELGYAAFFAGDLDKARHTNDLALAAATEPAQKAQVLFNQGMVEEKQGHTDQARTRYRASLALRPHPVVQKRLDTLTTPAPCEGVFTDTEALCACRVLHERDDLLLSSNPDSKPVCAEESTRSIDGLKVVRWGSGEDLGENQRFLAARGKDGWRKVADVGSDFEPGAFGVHNEGAVDSITGRTIDGHRIAVVEWSQHNIDTNMAGLELNAYEAHFVTLCVLDDTPRCPVSIPLRETTTLEYQRDLVELSDTDTLQSLAELERDNPPFQRVSTATYTIDPHGKVKVTETRGKRAYLAPFVTGVLLW